MVLKIILYILIGIAILFGLYKMFIDDEKGVGYTSFIFAVLVFFVTAAGWIAENWRQLWGRTGQSAAFGTVGYYGFTTSERTKENLLILSLKQ